MAPAESLVLTPEIQAQMLGLAGLVAQMVWPFFRSRQTILMIQLGSSCAYASSYGMLGQDTATAVCLLGAIQTVLTILAGDRPWMARAGLVTIPLVLVIGATTYSGLPTICATTAACLMMIGRLQHDALRMRGIQLGAKPFGAAHDALVGAWPAFAGAALSAAISAFAYRRERRLLAHGAAA